ncbi:response regulator transcription factor [Nocardiopsis coralliicola]
MTRILIAEDEERIASFVRKGLLANGFTATVVGTAGEAVELALDGSYDLMVLDIGLPDGDGFSVLRRLRERGSALPVVVLTARDGVRDTVTGLEIGADDYMTKPFRFEELLARIRLRMRTSSSGGPAVLEHSGITLDLRTRRARADGAERDLTAREFSLLELLMRHPGQVLTRQQMLSHVWGYDHDPGSNVVDVFIRALRKKVGHDRIATVRGMGYRLGR